LIRSSLLNPRHRRAAVAAPAVIAALAAAALGAAAPGFAAQPGTATPGAAMPGDGAATGAAVFADHCAVCHGPTAAGIPRSFPSLHEQVVAFAKIPQGRDYLVMVVTTGLMGSLTVGGVNYNGVMPAQTGLSEAQVAAVLNYLASGLGENESGAVALSAADVADARARHADKSAQATRALRPASDL
jgi:mono/diheme cytochrome c family protein